MCIDPHYLCRRCARCEFETRAWCHTCTSCLSHCTCPPEAEVRRTFRKFIRDLRSRALRLTWER